MLLLPCSHRLLWPRFNTGKSYCPALLESQVSSVKFKVMLLLLHCSTCTVMRTTPSPVKSFSFSGITELIKTERNNVIRTDPKLPLKCFWAKANSRWMKVMSAYWTLLFIRGNQDTLSSLVSNFWNISPLNFRYQTSVCKRFTSTHQLRLPFFMSHIILCSSGT